MAVPLASVAATAVRGHLGEGAQKRAKNPRRIEFAQNPRTAEDQLDTATDMTNIASEFTVLPMRGRFYRPIDESTLRPVTVFEE